MRFSVPFNIYTNQLNSEGFLCEKLHYIILLKYIVYIYQMKYYSKFKTVNIFTDTFDGHFAIDL